MNNNILILDIETRPITAWVWRLWDQNVGLNQIVDNGGILCVGLKWLGHPESWLFSEWEHGKSGMIKAVHEMISQADAVLTYNGDSFDLAKLQGAFLLEGLTPPPPVTSIDLYKTVKKLGFISKKLGFIGPLLGLGKKLSHEGFELWVKVMAGNETAQRKMARYCIQDVKLLEKVYKRILPYIRNHPFLGETKHECGACGSNHVQSRGYRRTKAFKIQRVQCVSCGSWQDGTRSKVSA